VPGYALIMMRRIIPAVAIAFVFILLFSITALKQNSIEKTYRESLALSQVRAAEIQEVIDAGVESFTPTYTEFYWPGCTSYKYTPTAFEAGFCDGTNLAHVPFEVGAGLYENRGIAAKYLELVKSKDDGEIICELSTDIRLWRFFTSPAYDNINTKIDFNNKSSKSEYVNGCVLGISKSFNIGLKQEESRVNTVKKINERKPTQENGNQDNQKTLNNGIDVTSNAYKTMFSVGSNFAKISLAGDTAQSQCESALNTGIISAQGIPRYLGVQTAMIQSLLQTKDGWQGCIDGFGQ